MQEPDVWDGDAGLREPHVGLLLSLLASDGCVAAAPAGGGVVSLTREQRAAYGTDWPAVSREVRERSGGRCECTGECGWTRHLTRAYELGTGPLSRCWAVNGESSPYTGSRVVLTAAHLDRNPGVNNLERLRAMCQGCHLAYDRRARP